MTDPTPKPSPTHNRRRFLALVGISAASAPLAVKAAEEAVASELTTLSGKDRLLASTDGTPDWYGENSETRSKVRSWLSTMGGKLPAHIDESIQKRAKYVDHLDPDIACKKSWSLVAKINEQRQRNYKQYVDKELRIGVFEEAQKAFEQATGFTWPY